MCTRKYIIKKDTDILNEARIGTEKIIDNICYEKDVTRLIIYIIKA